MKKAIYVCVEGVEGVGKTTQVELLTIKLKELGFKVLKTKEPGTPHLPITMKMRELMLSNEFDNQLTKNSRELISQAIRSIHIEKLIIPSMFEYDFIIQDRGVLSGYSYGVSCGNDIEYLKLLTKNSITNALNAGDNDFNQRVEYIPESIYDLVILLDGDVEDSLNKAISSKNEFEAGDAMESRGLQFINRVADTMKEYSLMFNVNRILVNNKTAPEVNQEIMYAVLGKYNEKK